MATYVRNVSFPFRAAKDAEYLPMLNGDKMKSASALRTKACVLRIRLKTKMREKILTLSALRFGAVRGV